MIFRMKKGIILTIVGLIGLIGTFVLWGLTPKEKYIWGGGFYVILCIVFPIVALIGLYNVLINFYTKDRYDKIRNNYKLKYDSNKSMYVNISELIYYVNLKYLGGDRIVVKYNDEFHIIERQVFSDHEKKKFVSIYNLDENLCGVSFDKLLCEPIFDGRALIEMEQIEVALVNEKYPQKLKNKRIYDNVKPHTGLMSWSIILLIFGVLFLFISFTVDDWYTALAFSGGMIVVGSILMAILVHKIKEESLIK